jgi:hypothetical protein
MEWSFRPWFNAQIGRTVPTSDNQGKFIAKALIDTANPTVIWDIGPGEGTYYHLIEESGNDQFVGNLYHWVGVEIWKPYITEYHLDSCYDLILNKDIREYSFEGRVDPQNNESLIIFGDVLEHMTEDEARAVIMKAKKYFRYILVSIPIVHAPQGEVNGNPYEAHVKHWTFDEMHQAMGNCMAFKGHTIGLYWWDSREDV